MEILGKLFGSTARVKILRLFVFNPDGVFDNSDVAKRSKTQAETVRRELNTLERIGLVRRKSFFKEVYRKQNSKSVLVKRRVNGWTLDQKFVFLRELQSFLLSTGLVAGPELVAWLREAGGTFRLIVASGVFIENLSLIHI